MSEDYQLPVYEDEPLGCPRGCLTALTLIAVAFVVISIAAAVFP